jgi:NADPH2:quinone reductase
VAKVIQMQTTGGPSVLKIVDEEVRSPEKGEVLLHQDAIGINFVDAMIRRGQYPMPLPAVPGFEAAGTVAKVGPGVEGLSVGDRVAYFFDQGAYATEKVISTSPLVRLPDDISNEVAATFLAKGGTAWMGLRALHALQPTETILILGASGSVGSILSRWAKALGAKVIGVAGSPSKLRKVASGADHAFHAQDPDIGSKLRGLAPDGVDVVYDLVGRATFSLAAEHVREGGVIVAIGAASGPGLSSHPELASKAVKVRSGGAPQYVRGQAVQVATGELWQMIRSGIFDDLEVARYSFEEIVRAHQDIDDRSLDGLPVLVPSLAACSSPSNGCGLDRRGSA